MRRAADVRSKDESQAAAFVAGALYGSDCPARPFGRGRVVEVGVKVLILFHEEEQRALRHFLDKFADFLRRDAGSRFENGSESWLVWRKACELSRTLRPVRWAWKSANDFLRNLQGNQTGVLVFINIKNDGAGHRVQDVARSQMPVGLEHHLQRKGHVQQPEPASRIKRINAA